MMATYCVREDLRKNWLVYIGLVVACAIWCRVDVQKRAVIDPQRPDLHMTDFTVYTLAGAAFLDGGEPYQVANLRGWTYLYPPLFALLVAPLARWSAEVQVDVWFALSVLMGFGCYVECRRLWVACRAACGGLVHGDDVAQADQRADRIALWAICGAALAALFPTLNCLQRGQIGVAQLYPLLLGFRLLLLGRGAATWLCAGLVLAFPVALKLTPALPAAAAVCLLGAAAWFGRQGLAGQARPMWGAAGVVAGCALYFVFIPAALLGWQANLRHLHTWHDKVASKVNDVRSEDFGGDVVSMRNQSLSNAAYRAGNWLSHVLAGGPDDRLVDASETAVGHMPMDDPRINAALAAIRGFIVLVLGLGLLQLARTGHPLALASGFGLACAATLVISPVSRGHYFLLLAPATLFAPLWLAEQKRTAAALACAIAPAALSILHYVALPQAGRLGVLGLGTTVWLLMTLAWSTRPVPVTAVASRQDDETTVRLAA